MAIAQLENLVKVKQLHLEPPDQGEFDGMVESAKLQLNDARSAAISTGSQFLLAYGAAHALSLAELRWHGYRSQNHYVVFQSLTHTLEVEPEKIRLLSDAHNRRNLAEYEGHVEVSQKLVESLIAITCELEKLVSALGPVKN